MFTRIIPVDLTDVASGIRAKLSKTRERFHNTTNQRQYSTTFLAGTSWTNMENEVTDHAIANICCHKNQAGSPLHLSFKFPIEFSMTWERRVNNKFGFSHWYLSEYLHSANSKQYTRIGTLKLKCLYVESMERYLFTTLSLQGISICLQTQMQMNVLCTSAYTLTCFRLTYMRCQYTDVSSSINVSVCWRCR